MHDAIFFEVGGLHVAAEVTAINLSLFAFTADNAAFHFFCHGFTQLGQQNECRLVGQTQITREGECALALHFIAEHGDGGPDSPVGAACG